MSPRGCRPVKVSARPACACVSDTVATPGVVRITREMQSNGGRESNFMFLRTPYMKSHPAKQATPTKSARRFNVTAEFFVMQFVEKSPLRGICTCHPFKDRLAQVPREILSVFCGDLTSNETGVGSLKLGKAVLGERRRNSF